MASGIKERCNRFSNNSTGKAGITGTSNSNIHPIAIEGAKSIWNDLKRKLRWQKSQSVGAGGGGVGAGVGGVEAGVGGVEAGVGGVV